MTSNYNGDGDGLPSLPSGSRLPPLSGRGLPSSPALGGTGPGTECCPAVTGAGSDGVVSGLPAPLAPPAVPVSPIVESSVSGLELPAHFSTAHFLDPSFVAKIANELFAEG